MISKVEDGLQNHDTRECYIHLGHLERYDLQSEFKWQCAPSLQSDFIKLYSRTKMLVLVAEVDSGDESEQAHLLILRRFRMLLYQYRSIRAIEIRFATL